MSRRKQLKPKAVKDELLNTQSGIRDENEPVGKKCRLTESVKRYPDCEDNNRSASADIDSRLDCQLCSASFDSISSLQTHTLREHVPAVNTPPSIECQQCNSSFSSFVTFAVHMRSHIIESPKGEQELKCSVCNKTFSDNQSRLVHLISHFEVRQSLRSCTDCGLLFPNMLAFTQHCAERHLGVQYLCTICAHISDNQKEFREHSMIHSEESLSTECSVCRVCFESRELLAIHVQLVHDREPSNAPSPSSSPLLPVNGNRTAERQQMDRELRVLHCSVCDERCAGEDALDEHRLFSHCKVFILRPIFIIVFPLLNDILTFHVPRSDTCADCQEPLLSPEDFEKHTRMHARDMYMYCVVCRQSLRSETQLVLHNQFHMRNRTEKPNKHKGEQMCGICNKTLVSHDLLNLHLLVEHDARRQCPYCGQGFMLAHQLLVHVGEIHAEEPPHYTCDICREQFRFCIQFEHHRMGHNADTASNAHSETSSPPGCFSCPHCYKVFSTLSALQGHSHVHKDSDVRRCPICGLSFNTASRFENHVRKHANTSNCVCQICGDGFGR